MEPPDSASSEANPYVAPEAELVTSKVGADPLRRRAAVAKWTLGSSAVAGGVYLALELFVAFGAPSPSSAAASGAAYDQALFVGSWLLVLTSIAARIAFMMWMHRAHVRLLELKPRGRVTPAWAVGWWFVPFANLWKPFQISRDLWRRSDAGSQWPKASYPAWLWIWWGSVIVGSEAPQAAVRLNSIDWSRGASWVFLAAGIAANLMTALIVVQITDAQCTLLGFE